MDEAEARNEVEVRDKIRALAGQMAPTAQPAASPDALLVEQLGYDSLHLMSLVNEVFDVFELDLPDFDDIDQFEGIEMVGQLEEIVLARLVISQRETV
jgi:acyl carrier protein